MEQTTALREGLKVNVNPEPGDHAALMYIRDESDKMCIRIPVNLAKEIAEKSNKATNTCDMIYQIKRK